MAKKTRFIVPNLFTGLNFMLGIFSILITASFYHFSEEFSRTILGKEPLMIGAWMITWCVLLDKLDGFAAKVMNASSDFGAQFDSMADLISFGVAPAVLLYFYIFKLDQSWFSNHLPLMLISLSVYVLCASMRLARYNAIDSDELTGYFHGLPSTFAGGFIAVSVLLFNSYKPYQYSQGFYYILPILLIVMGILMVSPLFLPKLVKRKSKWLNLLQISGIVLGYICGFGMIFPEFLYAASLTYGVVGFGFTIYRKGLIDLQSTAEDSNHAIS